MKIFTIPRAMILILFLFSVLSSSAFCLCFAVLGDNRETDSVLLDIIGLINKDDRIEFVVNTGDFTSKGTGKEYEHYYGILKACKVKVYDVIGNHDIGKMGEGVKLFKKKYGKTYYSFDRDNNRFIIIDNSRKKGLDKDQTKWLKRELDFKGNIFVFMHKPLFDPTGTYPNYIMDNKQQRALLFELFKKANVRYVYAGHIHGYGSGEYDGVKEIVTAGGGAPLYLPRFVGGFYHYVKVKVDDDNIINQVIKVNYD